ncbi:MAG: hypothetical protein O8C63_07925 [Candidatus Methanoperedens sp.]|nr:hypothetical protein [Candidatus Methanoperedens sp.]
MRYDINVLSSTYSFDISLIGVDVVPDSLVPRIKFNAKVVLLSQNEIPEFWLSSLLAEVYVKDENGNVQHQIGTAFAMQPYQLIGEQQIDIYLDLDYYKIQQIEKIRKGNNFKLVLSMRGLLAAIRFVGAARASIDNKAFWPSALEYEFSKSNWIEKYLYKFNFKHVRLFEFPEILPPESLSKAIKHLDNGWTQFSSGHYNNVLVDCRKALEEVSTIVMKAGFKKIDKNGKGENIEVPDWQKIFESDTLSDSYKNIFKKLMGFAAPGAHTGKSINNEDALFTLMITHALIYYLVEKFPP